MKSFAEYAAQGFLFLTPGLPASDAHLGYLGSPGGDRRESGRLTPRVAAAVQAIGDLDPATDSVDDIRAGVATSEEAWQDVKAAVAAVDEADEAAVEESWTEMKQEIDDFPTDMPMTDAVVEVATAVAELQHAYGEMRDGLGCEGS